MCRSPPGPGFVDSFIDVQGCAGDGDHTKCDGTTGGVGIGNINGGVLPTPVNGCNLPL